MASQEPKEGLIQINNRNFILKPVGLSDVEQDRIYTWIYDAKGPGTDGRNMAIGDGHYDRAPLCSIVSADVKGITALNVHYFDALPYKTRFIMKVRKGLVFDRKMVEKSIHRYRLDRIQSRIYEVKDLFMDATVLFSIADWKKVQR